MNEIITECLRREGGTLVGFHELAARLVKLRRESSGDAGREDIVKAFRELVSFHRHSYGQISAPSVVSMVIAGDMLIE
jgi:hypothetical protein